MCVCVCVVGLAVVYWEEGHGRRGAGGVDSALLGLSKRLDLTFLGGSARAWPRYGVRSRNQALPEKLCRERGMFLSDAGTAMS